jgi:hypothetical protein
MSYVYRFHPLAIDDYNEAFIWYETKQKGLGDRFLKSVRLKLSIISDQKCLERRETKHFGKLRSISFLMLLSLKLIGKQRKFLLAPFIIPGSIPAKGSEKHSNNNPPHKNIPRRSL